jgi:alpha-tubulin suppressor-like RCC1 family protein
MGTLVESWSGYALDRSGPNVIPWILPGVDASSHTNVSCVSGAIRMWFEPWFSSSSVAGGAGPGTTARLADLDATSGGGTVECWSLQISADGTTLQLIGNSDSGPVQLLSTLIAWQANQSHLIELNYTPQGTTLFVDGQLAAQGAGTVAIPPAVGALVLGSSISGTETADGALDEFFSFDGPATSREVAFYYACTSGQAALGPVSAAEEQALGLWHRGRSGMSQMGLAKVYDPDHDTNCSTGGPVYLTNVLATLAANGTTTVTFDIQGGTNGILYDIFGTEMVTNHVAAAQWPWIGQGLTCNTYTFTNQPADQSFYQLKVPVETLTVAWGDHADGKCTVPPGLSNAMAVAGGQDFSLALRSDGTVIGWGDNTYGQTNPPPGLTNVIAIAAGQYQGVALLANGAVTNWGYYTDGENFYSVTNYSVSYPPPTSNVVAIAAGYQHALALLSNGTVVAWGAIGAHGTLVPTNIAGVKAIACGNGFNVVLLTNGMVTAWGANYTDSGYNTTNVPADLTNVVAISAFYYDSMALRANGTVEVWGDADHGATNVPAGLSNVVAVAAGGSTWLALQACGTVVEWGDTNYTDIPAGLNAVKAIGAGYDHSLAIQSGLLAPVIFQQPANQYALAGGSVTFSAQGEALAGVQYQWQFNGVNITGATNASLTLTNTGATNNGSYDVVISTTGGSITTSTATFTLVVAPEIVSTSPAVPATNWFNTNLTLSVGVYAAGQSKYPVGYQWKLNGTNISTSPASYIVFNAVATNEGIYTVVVTNVAGSNTVTWDMRLALPGMVEAWGADGSGEIDRPAGLTNAAGIAAGEYQSLAVTDSGTVLQWGKYSDGTNLYSVANTNVTTLPPTSSNLVAVAAGLGQALALKSDGTVTNWGLIGAMGNSVPANLTGVKAIACGGQFDVALLNNGTVLSWSSNNPALNTAITNVPSNLSNVTAIAAGRAHTLALSNGTVVPWGAGLATNVPSGLANVVAIAAGDYHSLALTSNGMVVAWGSNTSGQCTVPTGLSNLMAIAAGSNYSVALLNTNTIVEWGDNSSGQTTVPVNNATTNITGAPYVLTNIYPASMVRLIAAGGDHTLAAIWSPLVQYPVDVSKDLLLIYNSNSPGNGSSNVCAYYLENRPMVATANRLAIGCTNSEIIEPGDYATNLAGPVQNWLAANPTKRPAYVILFQDIPSRVHITTPTPSVQYELNTACATNWHPFVTSINMNGTGGTNDCIAYINKLAFIGSNYSPAQLILSATAGGYPNTNWYFDGPGYNDTNLQYALYGLEGVESNGVPTSAVTYTSYTNSFHITTGTNLAGYLTWGVNGGLPGTYPVDGTIVFGGSSEWYLIETIESYNGERVTSQGHFLQWFSAGAFSATNSTITNYSNTPVGAVSHVDEPGAYNAENSYVYFGLWAAEKNFAVCAWNSRQTDKFQAIGDPFTRK